MQTNAVDKEPDLLAAWRGQFASWSEDDRRRFPGGSAGFVDHMIAAHYSKSAASQAEFGSLDAYSAYMKAEDRKRPRRS